MKLNMYRSEIVNYYRWVICLDILK